MSGVQPPPPFPKAIRRLPLPTTIPTCCVDHRLAVLDHLSYLWAVDTYNQITDAIAAGWTRAQLDEIVDTYRGYVEARLKDAVTFGRTMWESSPPLTKCEICGAEISYGKCWGCGA